MNYVFQKAMRSHIRITLFAILGVLISSTIVAQTTDWKVNGNSVSGDSKFGTNTGYDVIFETENVERMRLTKLGLVGIGIDTPQTKLHVVGDTRLDGGLSFPQWTDPNASNYRFTYVGPDGLLKSGSQDQLMSATYEKDCFVKEGDEYPAPAWTSESGPDYGIMYTGITCPARVGIGTEFPSAMLDVNGDSRCKRLYVGPASIVDDGYKLRIFDEASGMNPPKQLMDIRDDGGIQIQYHGTSSNMPLIINRSTIGEPFLRLRHTGELNIAYAGTGEFAMTVRNTTDPGDVTDIALLTTDGKWFCQGIVVKNVPFWPDYVFSDVYKLRPLAEVAEFIEANNHLPDLPSAADIATQGLSVEEMMRLLTQKVEELTLYAIQQQQEIEALKLQLEQGN